MVKVVKSGHLGICWRKGGGQFLADGVENAKPGLFFDSFYERLFCPLLAFLRCRLIPGDRCMHWTFFVLAHVKHGSGVLAVDENRWLGCWALAALLGLAKLALVQNVCGALGLPCRCLGDAQDFFAFGLDGFHTNPNERRHFCVETVAVNARGLFQAGLREK